jgi:uncharacterized protein (DUF305 family)
MKLIALAIALALTLMPITANADDHDKHGMKMDAGQSEASKAYNDAMMKMHEKMSMKPTGNPDVDFAKGMIPHHEGAIDMAKVELQYGKDPELRKLAQEIVKAQETEIAFMKSWLEKNVK